MYRVAIHSVPRSGSTWLGSILDSSPNVAYRLQPLFSYGHKGQISENSSLEEIDTFFNDIYSTKDDFVLQIEAKAKQLIPSFPKKKISHIVYKEVRYHYILRNLLEKDNALKVIGIIRNPFAVINSWLKAPKEFKKELGWSIEEEWRCAPIKNGGRIEEFNGFEKWKEVTFLFMDLKKKFPNRFYLLEYGDLLFNKKETVRKLFEFISLELTDTTLDFLNKSSNIHAADAYSVYKIKENDESWKKDLPSFIIEEIMNDKDFQMLNKNFKWV